MAAYDENAIVKALLPSLNKLLGIRGQVAYINKLYLITRTYGSDGISFTETEAEILPIPNVQAKRRDVFDKREGSVEGGRIVVSGVSRASYPDENTLQTMSDPADSSIRLYKFNGDYYTIVQFKKLLLTYEMTLEKWNG